MLIINASIKNSSLAAHERAAGELVYVEDNDNDIVKRLIEIACNYDLAAHDSRRLECYLVFNESTSLWLMQTVGFQKEILDKVDVFATTREDLLAKAVLLKLPNQDSLFPQLARTPIMCDSESTVHLVIFGFSSQAEALAVNASLIAHYPNYCRDVRLRTRITIIDDDVYKCKDQLTQRYVHLFENSYYRTIDLNDANPQCVLHCPQYEHRRKDFVDIEWEFVNGNIRNEAVRQKLEEWSVDSRQQLTIALCHDDQIKNYNEAFSMPLDVYNNDVTILCHTDQNEIIRMATSGAAFASVYPFGESLCDIGILRTIKRMAQRVNYIYNHCFSLAPDDPVTAPSAIDEEKLEAQWRNVGSMPKQYSNIFNAMTLATKMHSVGHDSADWREYYALTLDEITMLTEVEHNRWNVEELILGYRPTTDEEQRLIENDISLKKVFRNKKIHYDLRAYDDLRSDRTGKNVNVYDMALTQGIPLIIKSCITD